MRFQLVTYTGYQPSLTNRLIGQSVERGSRLHHSAEFSINYFNIKTIFGSRTLTVLVTLEHLHLTQRQWNMALAQDYDVTTQRASLTRYGNPITTTGGFAKRGALNGVR